MSEPPLPLNPKDSFLGRAKASAISVGLDEYDDIFSDFDPSPYSERLLSEDFLHELQRASLDREEDGLVLNLFLPGETRSAATEKVILDRLKNHFRRRHRYLEEKNGDRTKTGILMVALGMVCMLVATYLLTNFVQTLWRSFIVVLLEPAGWFTFWEGLSLLVFDSKEAKPELVFYRKMSRAKILFMPNSKPHIETRDTAAPHPGAE